MALHRTMQDMRMVTKIVVWIMIVVPMRAVAIVIVKAMTTIMVVTAIAMAVIGKLDTIIL